MGNIMVTIAAVVAIGIGASEARADVVGGQDRVVVWGGGVTATGPVPNGAGQDRSAGQTVYIVSTDEAVANSGQDRNVNARNSAVENGLQKRYFSGTDCNAGSGGMSGCGGISGNGGGGGGG